MKSPQYARQMRLDAATVASSAQYLFVELVATGELLERLAELHKKGHLDNIQYEQAKKLALGL